MTWFVSRCKNWVSMQIVYATFSRRLMYHFNLTHLSTGLMIYDFNRSDFMPEPTHPTKSGPNVTVTNCMKLDFPLTHFSKINKSTRKASRMLAANSKCSPVSFTVYFLKISDWVVIKTMQQAWMNVSFIAYYEMMEPSRDILQTKNMPRDRWEWCVRI